MHSSKAYVSDRLPRNCPFTLAAESFSGPIALRLSQRAEFVIDAVVLVCSFGSFPLGAAGRALARLPFAPILKCRAPSFVLRRFLLGRFASEAQLAEVRRAIALVKPEVLAHRLRQALASRFAAGPIQPRCRVVALVSACDRLIGSRAVQSIARACPKAELHAIHTPHLALQTAFAEVARMLCLLSIPPFTTAFDRSSQNESNHPHQAL